MFKKIIFVLFGGITVVILGMVLFNNQEIFKKYFHSDNQNQKFDFVTITAPENPNISEGQKFIFQSGINGSTSVAARIKLVSEGYRNATPGGTVQIASACQPDKPVLDVTNEKQITFKNISQENQTLIVGLRKFPLVPSGTASVLVEDLFASRRGNSGISLISYRCDMQINPAGFLLQSR